MILYSNLIKIIAITIFMLLQHQGQSCSQILLSSQQLSNSSHIHIFQSYVLLTPFPKATLSSILSSPNTRIICHFIKRLKNLDIDKNSLNLLVVFGLKGHGLFQIGYLTAQGLGDRPYHRQQIVFVKGDQQEYQWLRKNMYANGLQDLADLQRVHLSDRNRVIGLNTQLQIPILPSSQDQPPLTQLSIWQKLSSIIQPYICNSLNLQNKQNKQQEHQQKQQQLQLKAENQIVYVKQSQHQLILIFISISTIQQARSFQSMLADHQSIYFNADPQNQQGMGRCKINVIVVINVENKVEIKLVGVGWDIQSILLVVGEEMQIKFENIVDVQVNEGEQNIEKYMILNPGTYIYTNSNQPSVMSKIISQLSEPEGKKNRNTNMT